ncbi:preprotein translocase subunit YajC [Streptomyces avicenniae]|uniref:preprotein translocase subunit YajC n=1 Tax=Streptomyces avicenniae TaxID=500153 RepID=UPI000A7216FD|nr:preprotein translocase subunit YajC [Streptomyces avicenniae]
MDIAILFPLIMIVGVIFMMQRGTKARQRQAMEMRDAMEPGAGVRTIGGLYAQIKEVREDTLLLEITPGVHAVYAKGSVSAVLDAEEYERIVDDEPLYDADDAPLVPDDASSLTQDADDATPADAEGRVDLGKSDTEETVARTDDDSEHGPKS